MDERYKELMARCDRYYEKGMFPPKDLCDTINREYPMRFHSDTETTFGGKQ